MAGIDPNIILSGAAANRAPQFDPADLVRLKVQVDQARRQNEAQNFEMSRLQQADQQQQLLRRTLGQGGTPQEMQQRLLAGGFIKEAGDVGEQGIKREGADLSRQKQSAEMLKSAAGAVLANPTEQNALAVLSQLEQVTGQRLDNDKSAIMQLRGDPNAIRRWAAGHALEAEKLLPKVETRDLGGTVETQALDPLTGAPMQPPQVRQKSMSPGELASNEVARGNLSVAQQRLNLDREKNTRESVSQQKFDLAQAKEAQKAEMRDKQALTKIDTVLTKVDEAIKDTGFFTSGLVGKTGSFIPGSSAYDLDKTIDTIKSNIGFNELQEMRNNSPTGGALGQVAVRELEFLQAALSQLDIGQSKSQQLKHLNQIKTHYQNWKQTLTGTAKVPSLPDPAQHRGYEATSSDGTTYVSDGTRWVRKK